jgi:hypothetical protein
VPCRLDGRASNDGMAENRMSLVRASLRWYGEKRLQVYAVHIREQFRRAYQAFLTTAS